MDAKNWLDRVTGGASVNAAAQKAEVPQKTLDTQLRSASGLKPDMIVKIARAYGVSPIAALVEFELISEIEARDAAKIRDGLQQAGVAELLSEATDAQLLAEIGKRLEQRKTTGRPKPGANLPTLGEKRQAPRRSPQLVNKAARKRPGKPKMGEE